MPILNEDPFFISFRPGTNFYGGGQQEMNGADKKFFDFKALP